MKSYGLDKEEKDLLKSYEGGQWKSAKPGKARLRQYAQYARLTLRKDQRINIRLSQQDLHGIQAKAVQEGMPYQTLIASVLHKYISGRLAPR